MILLYIWWHVVITATVNLALTNPWLPDDGPGRGMSASLQGRSMGDAL